MRSGLSSCVVVAEEGVDGEGGVELVGGELEKVGGVVEGLCRSFLRRGVKADRSCVVQ